MMPDANRQWFVYFKDQEMGPFSEADLSSKLKTNELDGSAYVFTEGMSDWTLVGDTPMFVSKAAHDTRPSSSVLPSQQVTSRGVSEHSSGSSAGAYVAERISAGNPDSRSEADGQALNAFVNRQQAQPLSRAQSSMFETQPLSRATRIRRAVLYTTLVLVAFGAGAIFWVNEGGYVPGISEMLDPYASGRLPPPSKVPQGMVADGSPIGVVPPVAVPRPTVPVFKSFDWSELTQFRKNKDPKGPPFRIGTKTFGDERPIVVGVLSPLIRAERVSLAIFPDNEKNLMPVAKIWFLSVPVVDGYFSAGPFNLDSEKLPSGRYHVLVGANQTFLGQVNFDVGSWPSEDKLVEIRAQLQKERLILAERERSALELKVREINAAVEQLKLFGANTAGGMKTAAEWARVSRPWREALLRRLEEQRDAMNSPMFYSEVQSKLYEFMSEALRMQEALDIRVTQGGTALFALRKKSLGKLWTDLGALQGILTGEVQLLGQSGVGPLKLDAEIVKRQLLEKSS